MKFTLSADGAQAAGQGIGSLFKAYAMGPQMRQQAEQEAMFNSARMAQAQAGARKDTAEAGLKETQLGYQKNPLESVMLRLGIPLNQRESVNNRINTGSFGPQYDALPPDQAGPVLPAPVDSATMTKLGEYLAMSHNMYGTGSNVQQASAAELNQQTGRIRDQAVANVGNVDLMNRFNTLAKEGETYMPFKAMGDTGGAIDQATGKVTVVDAVLRRLFEGESGAKMARDRGAANASNASAGNSSASASLTREKLGILKDTGSLPGAGDSGEDATNAKSRNAIIAAVEREMSWADDSEIMAEVEKRLARRGINANKNPAPAPAPGGNKNPPAPPASGKMSLPPGVTSSAAIAQAKQAIANGKDRAAVIKRLQDMGVDTKGL